MEEDPAEIAKIKQALFYSIAHGMKCYFCRTPVPMKQHAEHMHILDSLIEAEAEGYEDLFVHTVGPGDEFDAEGNVAACDRCFIKELADSLKTPFDHPEWLEVSDA